jgi:hypothetical protein
LGRTLRQPQGINGALRDRFQGTWSRAGEVDPENSIKADTYGNYGIVEGVSVDLLGNVQRNPAKIVAGSGACRALDNPSIEAVPDF